jgi:microcystin degradation protein MlrC
MRVFIAGLGTETNMFVPFPTGRRGYEEFGVFRGDATRRDPSAARCTSGAAWPRNAGIR